jgi:basic membrane protein A
VLDPRERKLQNRKIFVPRRQVIRGILGTAAFGISAQLWTGCSSSSSNSTENALPNAPDANPGAGGDSIKLGFIYVGSKADFGYNQAHAEGAQSLTQITNVEIVEEANVPETTAVAETMRSMIEIDGVNAIFPTSFGYFDPHILELAPEFPDVQFFHFGGIYKEGVHPNNIGTYFSYIDEAQYLAGIVAAHTAKSGKVGFVAAKPIPLVLRNINSFILGMRSINPDATVQVVFTGDWSEPIKEAEATNSLIDQGVELISCHVDSPKVVVETAEKRGVLISGYHADHSSLAPNGHVTGAIWDWSALYGSYANLMLAGKTVMNGEIPRTTHGGLAEGFVKLAPFGDMVGDTAKQQVAQAEKEIGAGDRVIYSGPIKSNTGEVVIADGEQLLRHEPALAQINWLAEGVIGSPTS